MIGRSPEAPRSRTNPWLRGRVCPRCSASMIGGPMMVCANNHRVELVPEELRWPIDPHFRFLKERGYWLRWLIGVAALVVLAGAIYTNIIIVFGFAIVYREFEAVVNVIAFMFAIVGVLLAPAVLRLPTSRRIEREVQADVQQ